MYVFQGRYIGNPIWTVYNARIRCHTLSSWRQNLTGDQSFRGPWDNQKNRQSDSTGIILKNILNPSFQL